MNNEMINIDDNNSCYWCLTPWDERALGVKTATIHDIKYDHKLSGLFALTEARNRENNIRLFYFRHDANDLEVKRIAMSQDYHITEMSLYAYHNNISKIGKASHPMQFERIDHTNKEDVSEVKNIAAASFQHGRFHEDPQVDRKLAQQRYILWIDDLIDGSNFYIYRSRGIIRGFFCYQINNEWIEMPLGGLSDDAKRLGGFFLTNIFNFISENKPCHRVRNLISCANIPVINVYAKLGFTFGNPLFGYRKFY